jgi:CRP-like cAMP-binding protein
VKVTKRQTLVVLHIGYSGPADRGPSAPDTDSSGVVTKRHQRPSSVSSRETRAILNSAKQLIKNKFLVALPADLQKRLLDKSKSVRLNHESSRSKLGKEIREIYFPLDCLIGLFLRMPDDTLFEIATIGCEGISSPSYLPARNIAFTAICLIPGTAFKLKTDAFRKEVRVSPLLERQLFRSTVGLLYQAIVRASCNQRHSVEQRSAGLLLRISDQINTERFPLTHYKVSLMLKVGRPRVTAALGYLQKLKLIDLSRGTISILNRQDLGQVSCDCYNELKKEYDSLYQRLAH